MARCDYNSEIHTLNDTQLARLETKGVIANYINQFPKYMYLVRLGYNKVDLVTARKGLNFQIIKVTINESMDDFDQMFLNVYSECREYVMEILYNRNSSQAFDKYEEFMGLVIMVMTVQRVITKQIKMGIQRDFYDLDSIEGMFSTYAIPFIEDMSIDVRRDIMKNIVDLIRHKSTDVVLYDILSLLGFNKVKISELYLLKEHRLDNQNRPIFPKKTIIPNPNKPTETVEVLDKEKAYNLTFVTVDKLEQNKMLAISNAANRRSYSEVTQGDPDWIEDYALKEYIMNEEFNYVKTKYLDLSVMHRLTKIQFEASLLFNMIQDNKHRLRNVTLELPKILEDTKIPIFDAVVICMALISKSKGFKGNIFINPSQIVDVMGFDFNLDLYRFKRFVKLDPNIADDVKNHIINLIPDKDITNVEKLNNAYSGVIDLYEYLISAMSKTVNIEEYRSLRNIYDTLFISQTNKELYMKRDGTIARTFREYLEDVNPIYGRVLDSIDSTTIGDFISHVINALSKLITRNKSIQEYGQSFIAIVAGVIELLRRFKSLTTRLIDYSVIYLLDSRLYNMIVLKDNIYRIDKGRGVESRLSEYRDMISNIMVLSSSSDKLKLSDKILYGIGLDGKSIINMKDKLMQLGSEVNIEDRVQILDIISNIDKLSYILDIMAIEDREYIISHFKVDELLYNKDIMVGHVSEYKWVDIIPDYSDMISFYNKVVYNNDKLKLFDNVRIEREYA